MCCDRGYSSTVVDIDEIQRVKCLRLMEDKYSRKTRIKLKDQWLIVDRDLITDLE